jgi:hypothetical protein
VSVDEATHRLLEFARAGDGYVRALDVEADAWCDAHQDAVSAAAHALATDSAVILGEETDARAWFPYSFMHFSAPLVG